MKKFWMIHNGVPTAVSTVIHDTWDVVLAEAQRLAQKSPNKPFYIMEAVACVTSKPVFSIETIVS